MHTFPEHADPSYDTEAPASHSGHMAANLFVCASLGFLLGLALLAAQNRFLGS